MKRLLVLAAAAAATLLTATAAERRRRPLVGGHQPAAGRHRRLERPGLLSGALLRAATPRRYYPEPVYYSAPHLLPGAGCTTRRGSTRRGRGSGSPACAHYHGGHWHGHGRGHDKDHHGRRADWRR